MQDGTDALNGNMGVRAVMDTLEMDWTPSPAGTVLRKRLHLVGEAESGQVTSSSATLPGPRSPSTAIPRARRSL